MPTSDFLAKLEHEAAHQAVLSQRRWLPPQLDVITSLVGNFPWQIILVLAGFTAVIIELYARWGQ